MQLDSCERIRRPRLRALLRSRRQPDLPPVAAGAGRRSFEARRESLRLALIAERAAAKRTLASRTRLLAKRARHDTRAWQVKRRERTRQLIELGGLVAKAGLVELTDDDRAAIFGLMVEGAATLRSDRRHEALVLWRRRGRRAFATDDVN